MGGHENRCTKGTADWTYIKQVVDHPDIEIPIFGNGDVDSPEKAEQMRKEYGVDGIMIGRATIGNPWIFRQIKHYFETGELLPDPTISERIEVCRRHLMMSVEWKEEIVAIREMRRHYSSYFRGMPNIKPLRQILVTTDSLKEILDTLDWIEESYTDSASGTNFTTSDSYVQSGKKIREKINIEQKIVS